MLIEPMNSTSLSSSMSLLIRAESHIVNLVFIFSYQSPPSYVVTLVSTYITRPPPPFLELRYMQLGTLALNDRKRSIRVGISVVSIRFLLLFS